MCVIRTVSLLELIYYKIAEKTTCSESTYIPPLNVEKMIPLQELELIVSNDLIKLFSKDKEISICS